MSEAADRLKHRLKTGTLGGDQDERDVEQVIAERESLERRLADETAIVDRIWDIYGRPSYKELAGRTIYDLINADRAALAQKTRECELRDGTLNMAVARLGGIVEGNPTGRHNFLQRIDELVAKEKDSYFPLYKSAKERVFALENELSDAKKQLAGCSCAARDYEAALQYGEGVGFGDEFKKVLICRQSLDSSQAQVEQLCRQLAEARDAGMTTAKLLRDALDALQHCNEEKVELERQVAELKASR